MRRIDKHFPASMRCAARGFDLRRGEVHALMGENGAGKSTLMKVLTGVNQPDTGEILIEGRAVTLPGPRAAQALGISIIHQELHLMSHLSAAQNIFIGREPRRLFGWFTDEAKANAAAAALFKRMRIDIDPRARSADMTVARQQLVEIAKALSFNARVLIMDEPTSALNDAEVEHLFAIIEDLKAHGVGDRLHHPQDGRGEAHRRPRYRDARRPDHRHACRPPARRSRRSSPLMVGRELADATRAAPAPAAARRRCASSASIGRGDSRRQLLAAQRAKSSGFAGPDGRGAHGGRARDLRRRRRSTAARSMSAATSAASPRPPTPCGTGSPI